MKREIGYYWVKLKLDFAKKYFSDENFESENEIGEWFGNKWWLCSEEHAFDEENFEEINEIRIKEPINN